MLAFVIYGLAAVPLVAAVSWVLFLWGLGGIARNIESVELEDDET